MADRGYASVFALVLLFGGVLLMGVATDIVRLAAAWHEASHLAHVAAETGAGWVQADPLYSGDLIIDRSPAESAARQVATSTGMDADVSATASEVCVVVRAQVHVGVSRLVGADDQVAAVTACASPRQG